MARTAARHTAGLRGGRPRVHIKKNDTVKVITGKSKDKVARVLSVMPDKGVAIVEGVNFVKKHTRPNPQRNIKGGIVEREASIHVSNLMIVSPDDDKRTRIGSKLLTDGRRVRMGRRSGEVLDK